MCLGGALRRRPGREPVSGGMGRLAHFHGGVWNVAVPARSLQKGDWLRRLGDVETKISLAV